MKSKMCVSLSKTNVTCSTFTLCKRSWASQNAFFLESLHPDVQTYHTPHFPKFSPLCNAYRHMDRSTTILKGAATTQHVHFADPSTCFPSCPSPTQIRFECPSSSPGIQKCSLTLYLLANPFPYV